VSQSVLVAVVTYNEGEKLQRLLAHFPERPDYDVLIVNDGSTDGTDKLPFPNFATLVNHRENRGVGAAIRTAIQYGLEHDYQYVVIMAGNGKMLPAEIPRLTEPLLSNQADYVQGSRYMEGGKSPNLPLFRRVAIRLLTGIINLLTQSRGTDITCGFRAYRLDIAKMPGVDIEQPWLDRYELEYYLHYKAIIHDLRIKEVPVSMVYPESGRNYSKIRPIIDWWSMLRPWLYLVLGLRR
jgi:dolichol-phosphate mannosyltransferase